jgi:N-acetylglucosaminyldiphosphoundecaprenol N-acetyl-beta-D-mannosaminyltransferase
MSTVTAARRVNVLGVGLTPLRMAEALATIDSWIAARESRYVCVADVHAVMESRWDASLRRIHNRADFVTTDGMPLVWLCRFAGERGAERIYGPDLMLALCAHSLGPGHRHFFFGGREGVADMLAQRLGGRFPGLAVAGTMTPPFRPMTDAETEAAIAAINAQRPDIVWVGLSTPKQERWMAATLGRIAAPVMIGVGAAFDFHAGTVRQAPRFIQRSGFEWAFRLAMEPRRLWRRYARSIPEFMLLATLQRLGLRRFDMGEPAER